jgi:GT2 family glycosyltransferase
MKKLPRIAVLMTCHNRKEKTLKCISLLFEQQGLQEVFLLEVFLVNDASTDGTKEAIKNSFPQVNVCEGDGNLFWNRGMHLAWESASVAIDTDYYLWLNDDTYLQKYAILVMLNHSNSLEVIVCGATNSKIDAHLTYGGYINGACVVPNGTFHLVDYFNGNCVLIPKAVYALVGNVDPRFHHGLGDFDYGLRAGEMGIESYLSPCFIGNCERHSELPVWRNPAYPLRVRLQALYSPLSACSPSDYFFFEKRHHGLFTAIFKTILTHLRVISPKIYEYFKSNFQSV